MVLLFAAAGALISARVAGTWYSREVAKREAGRRLNSRDGGAVADALRQELDLAQLRAMALAAGVSPDQVMADFEALRGDRLTVEDLRRQIREG